MKRRQLALAFLLAACGARTPLGTRDGGVVDVSAQDAASDAPQVRAECTWALTGPPVQVSADPVVSGDVRLEDAVPTTGGALVAWSAPSDVTHPKTAIARLVGFDLVSNGDEHVVLGAPDVTSPLLYVSLASGHGHVAAVAWNGSHCVLRPITVDGASNGAMVDVVGSPCEGLEATSPGFDLMFRKAGPPEVDLLALDAVGTPLAAGVPVFPAPPGTLGPTRRATLVDGSFIAAAPADAQRVIATHRDAHGATLGAEQLVSQSTHIEPDMLSIAPVTDGALVSWIAFDASGAHVAVSPLRADASPLGGPLFVTSSPVVVSAIDLAPDATGGALLAWAGYGGGLESGVNLVSLSAAGTPRGAPLLVPDPVPRGDLAGHVRLVTTGKQGLVFFEVRTDTTPHRVYAAPLACTP